MSYPQRGGSKKPNAALSGLKQWAKIQAKRSSPLFLVRLSALLAVFSELDDGYLQLTFHPVYYFKH